MTETRAPGTSPLPVGRKYIWLMVLASVGTYLALITPIAISLSVRIEELAPDNSEYLGYLTGAASLVPLVWNPLVGRLSDRTRSRWGRRRPYLLGGAAVGVLALLVMGAASSVFVLGVGWVLASLGWGTVVNALLYSQADRLPEEQRGKVAGLAGSTQMFAPVIGAGLASAFVSNSYLLMLVPGLLGALCVVAFAIFVPEEDSRESTVVEKVDGASLLRSMVFDPRRYPSFAWMWLGRALFNVGIMFATTFTAFFFADRLGKDVREISGFVAVMGTVGIVAGMLGALGGGYLSDRLRRRRLFYLIAAFVFTAGALVQAFGPTVPVLVAGSLISTLGIGLFTAVDQALVLDVLPERDTDAGRFLGIAQYAVGVPHGIAPLIASGLLLIGTHGDGKNYTLLFVAAGIFTVLGGIAVLAKVRDAS